MGKIIHGFLFIIHQEFQEKNLIIPKALNKDKKKEEENNNNKKESLSSRNKDTKIKKISLQDLDIEQGIVQEEEKIASI